MKSKVLATLIATVVAGVIGYSSVGTSLIENPRKPKVVVSNSIKQKKTKLYHRIVDISCSNCNFPLESIVKGQSYQRYHKKLEPEYVLQKLTMKKMEFTPYRSDFKNKRYICPASTKIPKSTDKIKKYNVLGVNIKKTKPALGDNEMDIRAGRLKVKIKYKKSCQEIRINNNKPVIYDEKRRAIEIDNVGIELRKRGGEEFPVVYVFGNNNLF